MKKSLVSVLLIQKQYLLSFTITLLSFVCMQRTEAQGPPSKAAIMFVHAHPDDEAIFGGGVLPYYSQVADLPVAVFSMVTRNEDGSNPITAGGPSGSISRVTELRNASDKYAGQAIGSGTFDPILGRYKTGNITLIEGGLIDTGCCGAAPFDTWSNAGDGYSWGTSSGVTQVTPGLGNLDGISDARNAAAWGLAREIRRYQPAVIVTPQDLEGDYGHSTHTATAIAVIDAYDLAADTAVDIDGLDAWQAKKMYLRGSLFDNRSSISWSGFSSDGGINALFHDFFEDATIEGQTPREVTDAGADQHVSQGSPDVSTVFRSGENFDGHHSEWWTLYRSEVGADTALAPFAVTGDLTGTTYTNWARGDFLENIDFPLLGDFNDSGTVDATDWQILRINLPLQAANYSDGDIDLDGDVDLNDFGEFRNAYFSANPGATAASFAALVKVPEPSSLLLFIESLGAIFVLRRRRPTTSKP